MKKILIVFFCMMMVSANIFAQSDLSGNGNDGKDKLGAWGGIPFIGLSYSHEFNDLMELDLLVGVFGLPLLNRQINIRTGLLFTIWEPVINGQKCPLTIGPAVDINSWVLFFKPISIGVKVLCPIRWEVNFQSAPSFNLFVEAAPAIGFDKFKDSGILLNWMPHAGLGLRYRIPNK